MAPPKRRSTAKLTIGALSRATGVPVPTLRTWERRYGSPQPVRLPSGHRRYGVEWVERLLLVRRALQAGHGASTVLPLPPEEVVRLPGVGPPHTTGTVSSGASRAPAPPRREAHPALPPAAGGGTPPRCDTVTSWFRLAAGGDAAGLARVLTSAWDRLGPVGFLELRLAPSLRELHRRRSAGRLGEAAGTLLERSLEVFLAARVGDAQAATGPSHLVVPAAPCVGGVEVRAAAALLAQGGRVAILLDGGLPAAEVAAAARRWRAGGVVATASLQAPPDRNFLSRLREGLPPRMPCLLVGSPQASPPAPGVRCVPTWRELAAWAGLVGPRPGR